VRVPSYAVWETVVFLLNALAFVMIGLQIGPILSRVDSPQRLHMLTFAAAVTVTVIAARAGWVMTYNRTLWTINRILGPRTPHALIAPPLNRSAVVAWCGMRGLVTLAAALALPDGSNGGVAFPYRDLILLTAFSVVLGTLVLQGLTLRPLVLALGFEDDDALEAEVRAGREQMLKAALASLGEVDTKAAAALYHEYEELLERADSSAALSPEVRRAEEVLRARAWASSRERLIQLRLTGAIGDPAFQLLEAELDRFELDTEVRSRW
jgi:monovalent cation/hydrogen antiporter